MEFKDSILGKKYERYKYTLANPEPWKKLEKIKGTDFIEYRKLLHKAESGELLTDFPIEVLIKTTLNCNHKCPKCLHGMQVFPSGNKYNMSFDTIKKVLDEGKEKGLRSVVFTGGEPTMHPQISEFLEYAGQLQFSDISLITNGTFLTEKLISTIINSGVTRINVSIDSINKETYMKTRGVDDFDRCHRNLKKLLQIRSEIGSELPLLSVSFVLQEENINELDDFVDYWEKYADGGIKIYPYKNVFSIVDEKFKDTYGEGKMQVDQLVDSDLPNAVSREVPIMEEYHIQCSIPWYRCHVGVNGEIQGCTTQGFCDHPEMVLGNINKNSFEEIWKSKEWDFLREITKNKEYHKHPVCSICQKSV